MRVAVYAPPKGTITVPVSHHTLPPHPLPQPSTVHRCHTIHEFEEAFARSELAILDVRQPSGLDVAAFAERLLAAHPFVKIIVMASAAGLSLDTVFRLGQLGVWRLLHGDAAADASVWKQLGQELHAVSLLDRFRWHVQPWLRHIATPLLTIFLTHVQAPAVKQLVHRAPFKESRTVAARRRALWRQCQEAALESPEDVLFGVRLMFIKTALDDGRWTHEQLAAFLEYSSASAMWRSVKRRSGYTVRTLRGAHVPQFYEKTAARFVQQPLERA